MRGEVSGKRYARESFVAGWCRKKILSPFCFQGTCDTKLFNLWLKKQLLPEIGPGYILIMDNATFHKSNETKQLIEQAGCKLLFLPAYSPDLNPIEKFWAKLKGGIKKVIHQCQSLQEAVDYAFNMV